MHKMEDNINRGHKENQCENMDRIGLSHNNTDLRALINTIMHIRVLQKVEISLLPERLSASQERLCPV
jgi:hypothetical protein